MDTEVFVVGIIFFSVVAIVKIVSENRTRQRLIDKGLADESVRQIYGATTKMQSMSSLKWGMVLVGIGVALLVGQLFPHYVSSEITFGLMFLFAGIGFLIYYPMAKRFNNGNGGGPPQARLPE